MWHTLRISPEADSDFVSSAIELLQSTSRTLILALGSVYLLCTVATAFWPEQIGTNVWLLAPLVALTCVLALRMLPRHFLAAQAFWQGGLALAITLAVYLFQEPAIALAYALLPLMAVVVMGWPAGALAEGLVIALVWWLSCGPLPYPLPTTYSIGATVGGAIAGLLGWASGHTLLTVTQWSLFSFNQARQHVEEVHERRAELARVLKDLDQAYYRLERANHALVLARAEAEEAKEARNRFALAISHELRTPLNFVLGFSELMANSPDTYAELERWPPGLYEDVQEIYRSSTHLSRLVNDVLDLGQIEALRMALIKEWVDPARIVREVEVMVRSAFSRKGLWFRTEIEPDLPNAFADHTRIRQVLLNLVSNSLRFTERGGVTLGLHREEENLLFCVRDTGPGIEGEDIPKLFEEFRQIGNGSWRRREGAGLGIPISRRFVELHGGRMWVESTLGEGTRFYFSLPLPGATRILPPSSNGDAIDARYWNRLKDRAAAERILLVFSPDPVAGEVIAQYAEDYGVIAVNRPDQLCAKVAELLPSAIILDQATIEDQEIHNALRELPYDLPAISFTFPGSPAHPRHLPVGVSSYLVKPVGRQALTQAVQALGADVRHLLVVDDDPAMVRFVTRTLKSVEGAAAPNGYHLATAFTGHEALEQLRENRPHAVLLDLMLPDISGWEVLDELRRSKVPTILITARDWPQMFAGSEQEALRITMRRPLSRSELTPVLKCLLGTIRPLYPTASSEPAPPADPAS